MRRAWIWTALAALLALLVLASWRDELPDVEIRYAPRQTTAGRIFPGFALGQGFRCEFDGLRAIDVALVAQDGVAAVDLDLALHAGSPTGPVLRRARLAASELPRDGWARFAFDPIADSSGVAFWFELSAAAPSSHRPWVRYRGVPYLVREWGDRVFTEREQRGELVSSPPRPSQPDVLFADLCAFAFAVDGLDAAAGPAKLTLIDPATGATLRTAQVQPRAPIASGWAFFPFEPLVDSRWRALSYVLELPEGARLVGTSAGHSMVAFHAAGELHTAALGATCRGEQLGDRDLVFRAWSGSGARGLAARLAARSGARLAVATLLWLAAIAVSVKFFAARLRGTS